jgi:hypothetical protein
MGQHDYNCYKIAHNIITEYVIPKYKQFMNNNNYDITIHTIDILQKYIVYEYSQINNIIPDPENILNTFTTKDHEIILCDAFDILFLELEMYDFEMDLEFDIESDEKFHDIISYYLYNTNLNNTNHVIYETESISIYQYYELNKEIIQTNDTFEFVSNNQQGYTKHKLVDITEYGPIFTQYDF